MKTSNEKGLELEHSVHAIEAVILESSPSLRGQSFRIEPRKILVIDGVRQEIDILVTVGAARGYESIFIFECKNWDDPVGKNELIIFSEKIKATRAQRGYFVATAFTKDALAQAATDPRLVILYAAEHDIANAVRPLSFHITIVSAVSRSVAFRSVGSTRTNATPMDLNGKTFYVKGQEILVTDYLLPWMEDLYQQHLSRFPTAQLPEGVHPMMATDERSFVPGDCILDGKEIESVRMEVEFGVEIIHPQVISDYEVATRGRVVRLAKVKVRDMTIDTAFVKANKD